MSSLNPHSQVSSDGLPQLSTVSEMEESLFNQLFSGDFSLSGSPSALNPNKVILTVDRKTREVQCMHLSRTDYSTVYPVNSIKFSFYQIVAANEEAYKLFDCSELIGKKLSCILKKTSQVLEDALEENVPLVDGTVAAVTGKVV